MKKIAFHNLGCKVNTYELDAIIEQFRNKNYDIVAFDQIADIYVINTCSVTNIADRKSRQMIHRVKKMNPSSVVVAIGCYVQTRGESELLKEGINLCIGNNNKGRAIDIIEEYIKENNTNKSEVHISNLEGIQPYDNMHISSSAEHTRVFIKIQDGCNQFCSYCIIPYARGRVRSRDRNDIVSEIRTLASRGYQEVVITGIHISSYGTDFIYDDIKADRTRPEYLLELLEMIAGIDGIKRIRLGSLEPRIINDEFCSRLSRIEKVCPHFHLSLQSGSNNVLKRMNRHYSAEDYKTRVDIIRRYYEHPAITTDVIVGFPGESEEEFKECVSFLKNVEFYEMHIFKYSRRSGTVADKMPGQLTEKDKKNRSDVLENIEKMQSKEFREYYIGKAVEVLFEEEKNINGEQFWIGHCCEYVRFAVKSNDNLENKIMTVKGFELQGEYVMATIQ